uniref:Thioredoxin domain-containing protein n=1 Tax=Craspedostauros australis TaxID=1486917 RepID=A0A6T6HRF0_9STRA
MSRFPSTNSCNAIMRSVMFTLLVCAMMAATPCLAFTVAPSQAHAARGVPAQQSQTPQKRQYQHMHSAASVMEPSKERNGQSASRNITGPSIVSRVKRAAERVYAHNPARRFMERRNAIANYQVVTMVSELQDVVADSQSTVAVMYHASWCKSCQSVAPHFRKMSKKYPHIKFIQVQVTKELMKSRNVNGITKFPYAQIYTPNLGLVVEQPLLRKHLSGFEARLLEKV